jgi:transcriptional regulator with PAS, ATPase and Fis domain
MTTQQSVAVVERGPFGPAPRPDAAPVGVRLAALIGASEPMRTVRELIGRVAPTEAAVLISGETGTGKEVVAATIHALSRRSRQGLFPLNCGAVPAALIETELFGHERGSFTGADRSHKGYFERADRGTLFLDELTEMPGKLQIAFLRVLETHTVSRVGGNQPTSVDVRIIAAMSVPPEQAMAEGRLREDLQYRLNVFPVAIPPLRDRGPDILLLADEFLGELNAAEGSAKELSKGSASRLLSYAWPGNVRELKNLVQRAFILAGDERRVDCVPPDARHRRGGARPGSPGRPLEIEPGTRIAEAERRLILATVGQFADKREAAALLGISLKTLYIRLREYGHGPAEGGGQGSARTRS